ncbi:obscurin-like protein 1 [Struthio camelus]|uniref:obscurin-like protein 1 n=1 Tax=Struthio camelus TaxID=8801 RepID=UPI003603F902
MDGFAGAPRFLAYPRTFTVQNGADAVLKCQIAGDPRPSILWEKDRTPIEPSGRFHVEAKGNVYSLLVSRVTPEDSGLYVCKAKNNVGETYAAATLKVEAGEPQEEGDHENKPPVFLVRPSSMRVCRGEDVMFTCRVSGQPCPVLHWEKDGHELSDLFESSHFSVGKEPEDWHFLKLFSARPPDGGVYVCRARSGSREALAAAVLLVEPLAPGLPDERSRGSPGNGLEQPGERQQHRRRHAAVQSTVPEGWALPNGEVPAGVPGAKAFAVSAGKHAKFRCYVTGKPKPEIVWKKDGKPVTPGRRHLVYEDREGYFILKVLYCKPQDQGLYICTASNTAGQTLSAVQLQVKEHRVRFQVQLADVEVQEREDAVLECHVPLETIPTAWYLEDKELQPSPKYVMEEHGVLRRLTIRDARTDDDGIYLCQMKDKGRSVAEVSVRGVIVKRLPRKLDVMEGENAAFCVETREAVEGICWSRNGQELQESSHTVLKSFGRTHLLVLVHVTREEAGVISFAVGESQTSSQLRVKCVKRDPPSTPVAARMSTEHSNAALLTWCPAPDVHHRPPSSYVLERQEVSTSEWVHCLTTDLASLVEVLGDSVPCEADYRFRVCAVNKYGRSRPVEFPGSVHLVPAARLERGLQDARVRDGEDAHFSLELSASVRGAWFLNGVRLGDEEAVGGRYCVQHCKMEHSLLIRGVRLEESGAQVTFVSSGIRDSATLQVQAQQVHIAPVPEAQRLRKQPAGLPVLLECEVSPPGAPVCWVKDGEAVPLDDVIAVQAEGHVRRLLIRSAGPSDSGIYTCDAGDDAVSFVVTVTEPPVRIVSSNEDAPHAYAARERVVLWCELSRADAPVHWYKDGLEVEVGESLVLEREGPRCRLVLPCTRPQDAGEFVCDAGGDSVFYNVTVAEPPVRIVSSNEDAPHTYAARERAVLWCELSRADAPVHWYKDGLEVEVGESLVLEREGPRCRLVLPCARPQDAGEFVCDAGGDSVFYNVTVAAPQVHIAPVPEAQRRRTLLAGQPLLLECEVSPPGAPVRWLKDGEAVVPAEALAIQSEGCAWRLLIRSAGPSDAGTYTCEAGDAAVSFAVTVSEPPVRIVSSNEDAPHAYAARERAVLWCELSRADAPVHWYKDGLEVEVGESLVLEREGPRCRLVLPCARPQDAGEFVCDAGDASASYNVTVAEPRVRILHPLKRSLVLPVLALEPVELRCELSVPDAPVRWFKDGLEVDESDNLLLRAEGAWRRLIIPKASAEDAGEYICESRDEAVSFDVRVSGKRRDLSAVPASPSKQQVPACSVQRRTPHSELPVKILQPRRPPPVVKASPGETVTLACELSRADAPVCWAKEGIRLEAGGSVVLEEEGAHRRLLIPAARAEHSGKYVCNTADDTVTFTVQVSDPLVRILERDALPTRRHCQAMEDLVLEVHLSHAHGEVKWYKDGEKLQDTGRVRLEEDGARRSLIVLGATRRDAGEYLCDTRDDSIIFCVTVEEPPVTIVGNTGAVEHRCLVAGQDLVLACELSRPDATVRWLQDGQEVQPSERVRIEARGALWKLTILGMQPSDSGCYVCDAASDRMVMSVEVSAQPVRVVNKEEAQSPVEALEGDSVTLVARLSPETAAAQWQKDGRVLRSGGRLLVCSEGAARSLTIKQTELGDSGVFLCDAGDDEVHFTLHVKEAPVLFVNKQEQPEKLLVLEGGSAVLSAIVSKEPASVSWQGPRQPVAAGERCELRREGRVHSLVLSNVSKEDAGVYTCLSRHDRMQFDVSVKELLVKFLRGLADVHAHEGETVVLWCELCKAKGDVVWLKDGRELAPGARREIKVEGRERSLVLSNVGPEDAGEYSCESNDDRTLAMLTVQVPRVVEIIAELHSVTVLEGEDATFQCVVSPEDVALTWQLNGQAVAPCERLVVTRKGLCHSLTVRQCQLADAATVTANAEGLVSAARLSVQEAQVLFVRRLQDVAAEEQQDVCLEVEVSHEAAEVQWMKQGVLLQPGGKYQLQESGRRRTLTIRSLSPSDRGTYRCESLHDRTQAKLCVEPRKVSIRTPLADVETFEKETATFHLELSHAGVPGVWTRDGIRVKPSGTCRISATGCAHSLTLQRLTLEDSGTVTFTADTLRCSARLLVREPPVTMVKVPRDLGVPETGAASFECELSRPTAEVKWYKDGTELRPGPHCRIYSAGRRRLLQLSRCELADAGVYTCDAGDCRASATLHVHERQVCIVQELQDACVPENDNAVFTCEASHGDVKGEWFRDGEKIKVTSTVKIRQEGTKHFLLICGARPEDAGLIRFVAKTAVSEANLRVEALPIRIVKPLRDKTVLARHKATLECTVSHARGRVRWFRGDTEIFAGDKYEICNLDCYRTLVIHRVGPEDEDSYTCDAFDDRSTARLLVEAEGIQVLRGLRSVEVVAPAEARFECEVSGTLAWAPQWSLNGEVLRAGAHVRMESQGRVHRLTLCRTAAGMSGVVKVSLGQARSKAQLTVRGS